MRMHPNEALLIIRQEQAERRRHSAESELRTRGNGDRPEPPPSDVVARAFGRPRLSHPLRTWVTLDADG
jgi:hypothetical protein